MRKRFPDVPPLTIVRNLAYNKDTRGRCDGIKAVKNDERDDSKRTC